MKKIIGILTVITLTAMLFCSCGRKDDAGSTSTLKGEITVVSREEGSGTRDAFVELAGIVDEDENDITYDGAEITNSTSVMLTTVNGNARAIGYVSLGSLSDEVKAVSIDGTRVSPENIKSGSYKIARPFNVCYKDGTLSGAAEDFLGFVMSKEGQEIIEKEGYIKNDTAAEYEPMDKIGGKIVIAGSTSVAPVMEIIADEYKSKHKDITIEIQQTGSSAGISSAIEGVCDLGMSSRDLKDDEAKELKSEKIAMDGIAVIVNKSNKINDISAENVKGIFSGEITDWSEVEAQ